jgi:uncharacterized protein (TIGR02145 family)
MKRHFFYFQMIFMILCFPRCQHQLPGKAEILAVDDITHNSMVVLSAMKDIGSGVGLQTRGVCLSKSGVPDLNATSFPGIPVHFPEENGLTGISGLEPDSRYVIRAYYETNEGVIYSNPQVVRTYPVDRMSDPRDGKNYPVRQYGNRFWMVQNLDHETPGSLRSTLPAGSNPAESGLLYTCAEAAGACPPGWHLPSDDEWKELETTIGVPVSELDRTAFRGSPAGGRMKEPGMRLWLSESAPHSSNSSAFTVVPSGWYRTEKRGFTDAGTCAGFWTAPDDRGTVYARFFYSGSDAVSRNNLGVNTLMLSVRCIKD